MAVGSVTSSLNTPGSTTPTKAPATASALASSLSTISGLASGLNTTNIVNALIAADTVPEDQLKRTQTDLQSKLTVVRSFNTKLLTAQLDLAGLKQATNLIGEVDRAHDQRTRRWVRDERRGVCRSRCRHTKTRRRWLCNRWR